MGSWVRVLLLLAAASACQSKEAPPPPAPALQPPSPPPSVSVVAATGANAAPSSVSLSRAPDAACKAVGKKGSTELGPIPDVEVQLAAAPDALYALGFTHELARSRLYRFSRAGGPIEMVAEQKGLGERKPFVVADGAAYYVQSGKLIRLGPKAGESAVLFDGVHSPVAVVGDRVLGIACDGKAKVDRLLEVPSQGGEPHLLAELPRASNQACRYRSIVADEREVFVADWNARAILAVSRSDKSVRTIASKIRYPGPLFLQPAALAYGHGTGLERVARDGSSPVSLAGSDVAMAPFAIVRSNGTDYFAVDKMPNLMESTLRQVPRAGGPARFVLALRNADPLADVVLGQGVQDFAVDQQCAYVAQKQYERSGVQIVVKAL
jgi:hypothetical protein